MKNRKSILLVDDHTLFREGLKLLLRENPMFVVEGEAGNAAEACKKAKELKPDLILMDVGLPDQSGIEAARLILRRDPAAKVIVISMYSKMDFVIKALEAGAIGYLVKDTTPEMLVDALTTVAKGHYYFDHRILNEIVRYLLEHQYEEKSVSEERYETLTPREQEIMRLVAEGFSSRRIASKLGISAKTVENHRARIMEKLDLDNVIDLVKYAARLGIIDVRAWEE